MAAAVAAGRALTVPKPAVDGIFEPDAGLTADMAGAEVRAVIKAVPNPTVRPLLEKGVGDYNDYEGGGQVHAADHLTVLDEPAQF
jgi:hypothetical protein